LAHGAELGADFLQRQSAILQDNAERYWLLVHIRDNLFGGCTRPAKNKLTRQLQCLVGSTTRIDFSPEYERPVKASVSVNDPDPLLFRRANQWLIAEKARHRPTFMSEVYLPELQMTHALFHSNDAVQIGSTVHCEVEMVDPLQGLLMLNVVAVSSFEASAEAIPLFTKIHLRLSC
jgi:hypothetical protein